VLITLPQVIRVLQIFRRHIRRASRLLALLPDAQRLSIGDDDSDASSGPSIPLSQVPYNAEDLDGDSKTPYLQDRTSQEEPFRLLVHSLQLTVTTLYQMQIRKLAPIERLNVAKPKIWHAIKTLILCTSKINSKH
jgi:hypothetical protein